MSQVRTGLKPFAAALAMLACGLNAPAWGQAGAPGQTEPASAAASAPEPEPAVNLALAAEIVGDLRDGLAPNAAVTKGLVLGLSTSQIVSQVAAAELPWCVKIATTIEADPDATEAVVEAAVRDGEPIENVFSCAVAAGGDPDDAANGADRAGADPVEVAFLIDMLTLLASQHAGVAITADGKRAYTPDRATNTVSVIDTDSGSPTFNKVLATISMGEQPVGVAIPPQGNLAYVTNAQAPEGSVLVIDIDPASPTYHTVLAKLPVGTGAPDDVAITPDGRLAYVTGGGVVVIDIDPESPTYNSVVATIPPGPSPAAAPSAPRRAAFPLDPPLSELKINGNRPPPPPPPPNGQPDAASPT